MHTGFEVYHSAGAVVKVKSPTRNKPLVENLLETCRRGRSSIFPQVPTYLD